jgi:FYVE/RhoGEF/PH domain-containing protein 1
MNDTSNHITSCVSGDIMKNFAPFLKLYTEYVKNFDSAMNIISALAAKSQRFAAIMDEIHVSYWLCLL